jgi:hypothetical protein
MIPQLAARLRNPATTPEGNLLNYPADPSQGPSPSDAATRVLQADQVDLVL